MLTPCFQKNRFQDRPEIYKQFLEILQQWQRERESEPIQDIYQQVILLFKTAPDLIEEFQQMLPEITAQTKALAAARDAEEVDALASSTQTPQTSHSARGEAKMTASQNGPATDSGYHSAGISHEQTGTQEDEDDTQTIITNTQELSIQEDLKQKLTATFADELYRSLETVICQHLRSKDVAKGSESVDKELLAQLLKEFSMKLRYIAQRGQQQDATIFIRQQRWYVARLSHILCIIFVLFRAVAHISLAALLSRLKRILNPCHLKRTRSISILKH